MGKEHDLRTFAERRRRERRRHRVRNGAFCAAAMAVIMVTAYLMMFPAVTLEKQTVCGLEEHTHSESCYQAGEVTLTCGLQEEDAHTHDESCYVQEDGSVAEMPVCGMEETQGHTHTDECYSEGEETLICGLTEHIHTDECVAKETEVCTAAATQAQTDDTTQTSEMEASETETSYTVTESGTAETEIQTEKETEAQTETEEKVQAAVSRAVTDAVQLTDDKITGVKLYYEKDGNWVEITNGTTDVQGNAPMRLEIDYDQISIQELLDKGCALTYNIGNVLQDPSASGEVYSGSTVIGSIALNADRDVTITFLESWLKEQQGKGQDVVNGDFYVYGTLDWENVGAGNTQDVTIGGVTITVHFEPDMNEKYGTVTPTKTVESEIIQEADGDYLVYTLTAEAGAEGASNVALVDTFSAASSQYIEEYVGVTAAEQSTADVTGMTEERPDSTAAGTVYIGEAPTDNMPVPESGSTAIDLPGTLVWKIGDMAANEVRTLTYRVKLKEGYTGGKAKGSITNTVNAYSGSYAKGSSSAQFTPTAYAYPKKTVGAFTEDNANGGGYITYTVQLIASASNSYILTNLRLDDSLERTAADIRAYLTYDEDSFHLYKTTKSGNTYTRGDEITIDAASLTVNNTDKSFSLYVESLEPGEVLELTYSVKVAEELETYGSAGIYNRAILYPDDTQTGADLTQYDAYNGDKTISFKVWNRKTAGSQLSHEQQILVDTGDSVYDITGGTAAAMSSPGSFTVPAGSFPYTVLVNETGGWDLSDAVLTDTLGDYLRYTGYVKVEAYDTSNITINTGATAATALAAVQGATKVKTVWLKIDGLQSFSFSPGDVGLGGDYAYILTYYAQPYNMGGISAATVGNTFSISGYVIGPGGGSYIYQGASSQTSVRVEDDSNFGASKQGWYFEFPTGDNTSDYSKGTVYWAIRVSGNRIPAGSGIKDIIQDSRIQVLRSDSLIGVYKVTLPSGESDFTSAYTNLGEFQTALTANQGIAELDASYYTYTRTSTTQATLIFNQDVSLNEGEHIYILLKTAKVPSADDKREQYTATNNIQTTGDGGSTWVNAGSASVVTLESGSILKEDQGAYTYGFDGNGNSAWKTTTAGEGSGASQLYQDAITENGTYLEWLVEVNWDGSIDGLAEVEDILPAGVELVYVRLYQIGSGYNSVSEKPATADIDELRSDGSWSRNEFTANGLTCVYYYQQSTGIIRWNVINLIRGWEKGNYRATFQVVCKVTDQDALQGESTVFSNAASVTDQEGLEHSDSAQITLNKQSLSKKSLYDSGSAYPFEITVNSDGEDLSAGSDTITLIDELGASLTLDITSLSVTNTYTGDEVTDWIAQVEEAADGSQTLRLTIPDNLPLTITYQAFINAAPGQTISISNVAHWEGMEAPDEGEVNISGFSYQAGGTAGAASTPSFELLKLDQYDTSKRLEGAVFTITKVKDCQNDGTFVDVTGADTYSKTTDADGRAVFSDTTDPDGLWMEYNAVYCLVETYAPAGYELDDTPVYFAVAQQLASGDYPTFPEGVKVWYRDADYKYTAYNHKGEAEVEKIFQDEDGNTESAPDGTYSFGIYDSKPTVDGEQPLQTLTITYAGGTATYTRDGVNVESPVFTNLTLGSRYYICELDEGQPIADGGFATINGKAFTVSYSDGGEVMPMNGSTAKVTVTNRAEAFLFPVTGGEGTTGYLTGGIMLAMMAGVLLWIKLIISGRREKKG